ncbi:hypothetical protein ABEB36_010149 [Hypothenemus hampei]|uniref:J domain-containing protein n=1 Tax=Hypothenemus hampei TaxID=57062 RepID=A0ABD1EJA8_HYPHA
MSGDNRKPSPVDAMDKILDNMTSEIGSTDGQYRGLTFPPQQNLSESIDWGPQSHSNRYMNYGLQYAEPRCRESLKNNSLPEYNAYNTRSNSAPQNLYSKFADPVIADNVMSQDNLNQNNCHSPMFDNLVSGWGLSNNCGTYTPFGNTDTFKPKLFDFKGRSEELNVKEEIKFPQSEFVSDKFNFTKDVKKTRPLAEVKPMRPSYSDVLTKPVPPTNIKQVRAEAKELKVKKDSRKNGKTDKSSKITNLLSRSSTNHDFKDLPIDGSFPNSKSEKKTLKSSQLNRKWNSLDNISESASLKVEEPRKAKKQEEGPKSGSKTKSKPVKNVQNVTDEVSDDAVKAEPINTAKNMLKKNKNSVRQKLTDGHNGGGERFSAKKTQRSRKKDEQPILDILSEKAKLYIRRWCKVVMLFVLWLFYLISDVCTLSAHLGRDCLINFSAQLVLFLKSFTSTLETILKRWRLTAWILDKFEKKYKKKDKTPKYDEESNNFLHNGLETNISMPTTGDEAMKRLLACKGKDPYSILGVTPKCSDDDIKKYYKRQAVLVHPDKNNQPGAEEAFKILVHAFDMIGTAEHRAIYDRGVAESAFVAQNFSQMAELLKQLQQKMEMNANTIRCSACGDRHKRIQTERPSYAARNCKTCKIHHSAREGDIWAEAKCFGFLWHYYACMEGSVYDITNWAACQKETLKHLKPDTHHVQYRIALGKKNGNQPRRNSQTPRMDKPDLENLLNSLYGQNDNGPLKRKNKNRK